MTLLDAAGILYGVIVIVIIGVLFFKSHKYFWSIFKSPPEEQPEMYKKAALMSWHLFISICITGVPFDYMTELARDDTVDLFKFAKDMLISLAVLLIFDLCIWWKKRKKSHDIKMLGEFSRKNKY